MLTCVALACATIWVYKEISSHEFIIFDDDIYVSENPQVQQGFTTETILWAFAPSNKTIRTYWHPLTWLSHMLDYQLFGPSAGMHLLVNLAIHALNSLLLLLIFHQMTGAIWKSAFIAALFALHPLNVESVAWVAARKNVLSTLFWMLTLSAYIHYAKHPNIKRYMTVMAAFLMGLLAKPMLVTLPVILLLLDYWPMDRSQNTSANPRPEPAALRGDALSRFIRLSAEKIPLIVMALITFAVVSLSIQTNKLSVATESISMALRLANALVSCLKYIFKTIWPHPLAIYYPFPDAIPLWQTIGAGIILSVITLLAVIYIKKMPYLFTGWFWFIITLSPVSGIIQQGLWPEMADRWAYVPIIGLFIIIAWGWDSITAKLPRRGMLNAVTAAAILISFALATRNQVTYWRNSISLFEHELSAAAENPVAHFNMGAALAEKGFVDQAIDQYYTALKLKPDYADVHTNLGHAFYIKGAYDKAAYYLNIAARLKPENAQSHSDLGNVLAALGQYDKALIQYSIALGFEPTDPQINYNMGVANYKLGNYSDAIKYFKLTIGIKPDFKDAENALSIVQSLSRSN
jgi:tetratricopeptide (TPR) repeat protein